MDQLHGACEAMQDQSPLYHAILQNKPCSSARASSTHHVICSARPFLVLSQGYAQPTYINVVRDPVAQLVSNWYYTRKELGHLIHRYKEQVIHQYHRRQEKLKQEQKKQKKEEHPHPKPHHHNHHHHGRRLLWDGAAGPPYPDVAGAPWTQSLVDAYATLDDCILEAAGNAAATLGPDEAEAFQSIPTNVSDESLTREQVSRSVEGARLLW